MNESPSKRAEAEQDLSDNESDSQLIDGTDIDDSNDLNTQLKKWNKDHSSCIKLGEFSYMMKYKESILNQTKFNYRTPEGKDLQSKRKGELRIMVDQIFQNSPEF